MASIDEFFYNQIIYDAQKEINFMEQNRLFLICGKQGSGKSLASIRLALDINPNFDVTKELVSGRYGTQDFIKLLNYGGLTGGDSAVIDEAGICIPAREFSSQLNKSIDYVFQIFRSDNLAIILNTISVNLIDVHIRPLFHIYLQTKEVNRKGGYILAKPFYLEFDPFTGKPYRKYPNVNFAGRNIQLRRLKIPLPPQEVIAAYKTRKNDANVIVKTEAEFNIQKELETGAGKYIMAERLAKEILITRRDLIRLRGGKPAINNFDIMNTFKCGDSMARLIKSIVMDKLGGRRGIALK